MDEFNIKGREGGKATFVLEVEFPVNTGWQGTIKWVEKDQTLPFRNTMELLKLIDSVVEAGYDVDMSREGLQKEIL